MQCLVLQEHQIIHGVWCFGFKRDCAAPLIVSKGHIVRLVGKRITGLKLMSKYL